ncbi:hypothetical protein [Mesorhizobium sp. B1-1-8]|uniref:hypothetical protein n=1 Tax=Mesorhizobium sp. B1-1-8 TaxID=2589976 RepID=UPI00112B56EB|nr:hypothetical protein [Mesorhizobium sp. B1-1-8]UCI06084.1 hypothetical protein FJ974_19945 [Mesorhizobium sp. B1-1-8]
MEIASTRLNSLLSEALTPQPVPAAKADAATTTLIKALIQPPAPSTVQSAQFAAQALEASLQRPAAQLPQRLSSGEIEDAYRAIMEADAGMDDAPGRAPRGNQAAESVQPRRGQAQPAVADSAARVTAAPPPSSFSPALAAPSVLVAANSNAALRGGTAAPRGHAPRSKPSQPLWMISVVTALISATVATIVVLLLR